MHVGKDTAADLLVKKFGFKKIGLADSLKQILSKALNIPIENFYEQDKKELPLTEWLEEEVLFSSQIHEVIVETDKLFPMEDWQKGEIDKFFSAERFTSLRDLMQKFGTECCRTKIDPDIWLKIAGSQIANCEQNYVLADVRFPNEREYFRKLNAELWYINRPLPEHTSQHASENQLEDQYDLVLHNITSLVAFKKLVQNVAHAMAKDSLVLRGAIHGKDIAKTTTVRRKGRTKIDIKEKVRKPRNIK